MKRAKRNSHERHKRRSATRRRTRRSIWRCRVQCIRGKRGRGKRCFGKRCRPSLCMPRHCRRRFWRSLIINVRDVEGRPLPGAIFALRDQSLRTVSTAISNIAGVAIMRHLPPGCYTLHELQAPDGFCPLNRVVKVEILRNGVIIVDGRHQRSGRILFINAPRIAGFSFLKHDANGLPLAGAVFELSSLLFGGVTLTATSEAETGRVTFGEVPPGEYILSEISVPAPHLPTAQTFPVTVRPCGEITVSGIPAAVFYNYAVIDGQLTQTTTLAFATSDSLGQPMGGVAFGLVNLFTGDIVATAISGNDGQVSFSDLPPGQYILREIAGPPGFVLSPQTFPVTVDMDGNISIAGVNAAAFGDFVWQNILPVPVLPGDGIGFFKSTLTGAALPGVVFGMFDTQGTQVNTAVSNGNGLVSFTNLAVGSFTMREVSTVPGYDLNPMEFNIVINGGGVITVNGVPYSLFAGTTLLNMASSQASELSYFVTDAQGFPLPGITFAVTNETGAVIATATSDAFGHFSGTGLPTGTYILREYSGTAGIPLQLMIEVRSDGTILVNGLPAERFQGATFIQLPNLQNSMPFSFSFYKASAQSVPLAGAIFVLQDPFGRGIVSAQSDSNGLVSFVQVPPGCYWLTEAIAPPGFQPNFAPKRVEVGVNGDVRIDNLSGAEFAARTVINCPILLTIAGPPDLEQNALLPLLPVDIARQATIPQILPTARPISRVLPDRLRLR